MALTEEEGNDAYFEDFKLLLHEPQDKERDGSVAQGLFSHTNTHTRIHAQIRRSRVKGRDLVCDHSCKMDAIVH